MFFSRSSSGSRVKNLDRYKAFHLQLNLWEAWLKIKYLKTADKAPQIKSYILIAQSFKAKAVKNSINLLKFFIRSATEYSRSVDRSTFEAESVTSAVQASQIKSSRLLYIVSYQPSEKQRCSRGRRPFLRLT